MFSLIFSIIHAALTLYFYAIFARFILEIISGVNPVWKPKGALLVCAEIVYTVTDPPVKFFRKIIPPINVGAIHLDVALLATFISINVLMSFFSFLSHNPVFK